MGLTWLHKLIACNENKQMLLTHVGLYEEIQKHEASQCTEVEKLTAFFGSNVTDISFFLMVMKGALS